ncbi:hypothetical protein NFI96_025289 [Prochilodus magdalenae]|nr:hypothetical protein NFI96_025289 [Prochilodus magdalenae]
MCSLVVQVNNGGQNVSNCTEELHGQNVVSFPTITADGAAERRGNMEMRNHDEGEDDEDEYDDFDDSVDIPSNEQTDLKKGTAEDSDLIYSETFTITSPPAPVSEMERSGAVLLTLVCVWFSRTSGAEVERRVRPGDDVTLYCDCVVGQRSELAWFRNCSDESHPPLLLTSSSESLPRYGFVRNSSSKSYDLFVKNVMAKDLGLYYCARREKDLHRNTTGYRYGNLTTRILLRDTTAPCADLTQTSSTPPVSDCSVCWKLLVSVCPVWVLLSSVVSSTCVYWIYRSRTKGTHSLSLCVRFLCCSSTLLAYS